MASDLPRWFVMIDGQESGPMTVANLSQRFSAGDIDAESYVWNDTMDEWLPAAQVAELAVVFAPKAAPRRPPPPPAAAKAAKAKAASAPAQDSHVFRGRDDEEEIVLELDLPSDPKKPASRAAATNKASAPGITPARGTSSSGITPAKGTNAPKSNGAAPAPAPSGPKFGGAAKPSSQPYGVAIGKEPPKNAGGRGMPQAPQKLIDEEDEDWANRTSVEPLPFGERVHQENVAGMLFESTDPNAALPPVGKTGSYALDMSSWASGQMNKPPSVDSKKPAAAAPAAAPEAGTPGPAAPQIPDKAAASVRANPVLRPPSSGGAMPRQSTTALRQPLPEEKSSSKLLLIIVGAVVLVGALGLVLHFAMK